MSDFGQITIDKAHALHVEFLKIIKIERTHGYLSPFHQKQVGQSDILLAFLSIFLNYFTTQGEARSYVQCTLLFGISEYSEQSKVATSIHM